MVFVAVEQALRSAYANQPAWLETSLWVLTIGLMLLTPLWLWRVMRVKSAAHLFLSTISLLLWVFAIGGPFVFLNWYRPTLGAIALPLYTLLAPIVIGEKLR